MNAARGAPFSATMGQTCNTIAYAVELPNYEDELGDRLYDAAHGFKPMCGTLLHDAGLIGFELATGGSGHEKAIDMPTCLELTPAGIHEHKALAKMIAKAEKQWPTFVAHIDKATGGKVKLTGTPRLFLAETETA